jgi:plastocyanin
MVDPALSRRQGRRIALWAVLCLTGMTAALAAQGTPAPAGCTLTGKVPVVPRKATGSAKGNYEGKGQVDLGKPDPAASAVWMTGAFAPVDPSKVKPAVLAQEGLQFRPALLVVQVGTPVSFPNRDPIYHNVVSYSAARKFDLGRYKPGDEPAPLVFDKPGTVPLRCEVHDHMLGAIVVVESPHFTKSDAEGNFRLEGLPAGQHTFRVWLGPKESFERTVELKPGETVAVDWTKPA